MQDIGDKAEQLKEASVAIYIVDEDYELDEAYSVVYQGYLNGNASFLTVEKDIPPDISTYAPWTAVIDLSDMTLVAEGKYADFNGIDYDADYVIDYCNGLQ